MVWKPRVVVASVLERDGRYLMVEEETNGRMTLSQPAGHLEYGETLLEAVKRETLEESAYRFEPEALLGMMMAHNDKPDHVDLRFAFCGRIIEKVADYQLDADISTTHWLTPDEIRHHERLIPRSSLVLHTIEVYERGVRLPLDSLHDMPIEFKR